MEKFKKLIFTIFVMIGVAFFINDDAISTFATNYDSEVFEVGNVYKSGDNVTMRYQDYPESTSFYSKYDYIIYYYVDGEFVYDPYTTMGDSRNTPYSYTVPQYEGEDVAWVVTSVSEPEGEYNEIHVNMAKIEHSDPKFTVSCDKKEIEAGGSAKCKVSTEYNFELEEADFTIEAEGFTVSDVKNILPWMYVKDTTVANRYLCDNNTTVAYTATKQTQDIVEFTLTAPKDAKTTTLTDNVKLTSVQYTDSFETEKEISDVKTTLNTKATAKKEETKKEEKKEEAKETKKESNPPTADSVIPYIIFLIFSVGVASVLVIKRKRLQ